MTDSQVDSDANRPNGQCFPSVTKETLANVIIRVCSSGLLRLFHPSKRNAGQPALPKHPSTIAR